MRLPKDARRWQRTIEFIESIHWNVLKDMNLDEVPAWKRYPVINFVLAIYADQAAQFLQSRIRYSAVPVSSDPEDISAAELAESLLRYGWGMMEMDLKKLEMASWLLSTGNGAFRTYWNTDTGDLIPLANRDEQTGQLIPLNPETLQPDPNMQEPIMVDAGEVAVDVLDPRLVRRSRSRKNGVMVGMLLNEDEVADRFGEEAVEAVEFSKVNATLVTGTPLSGIPAVQEQDDDRRALVIEHYLPRSARHPDGLWWTSSKRVMLSPGGKPMPLPGGIVPVTQFGWIPIPGSPISASPLFDITFSNKMYDEISAKMAEWVNKVLPKRLLIDGGGIEPGQINNEPGQELIVSANAEPSWDAPPAPPPAFSTLLDRHSGDMRVVGGYEFARPEEPRKGSPQRSPRVPTDTRSGREIALLEIASKPGWKHLGRVHLAYFKTFYTEDRTFSVVGPDKLHQWVSFSRAQLERMPDTLEVDEISLYSSNRQALSDTVISLMESNAAQILFFGMDEEGNPVIDQDRVETAMRAVGIDVGVADLDPDVAEARNEHQLARAGQELQIGDWQNNAVHLAEHNRLRKSMSYRSWAQPAKQLLEQNIQQHSEALQQSAEAERQSIIQTEREMREVRETAEMQANIKEELAKTVIEVLRDSLGQVMGELTRGDDES
jgi:hypothetical protein